MKKFNPNATLTQFDKPIFNNEFHNKIWRLGNTSGVLSGYTKLEEKVSWFKENYPINDINYEFHGDVDIKRFYESWIYTNLSKLDKYISAPDWLRKRYMSDIEESCEMVGNLTFLSMDLNMIVRVAKESFPELHNRYLETSTYDKKVMRLDRHSGSCSLVGHSNLVHPVSANYGSMVINGIEGKLTSPNGVTPDSMNYIIKTFGDNFEVTLSEDKTTKDYTSKGGFIYSIKSLDVPVDFSETVDSREEVFTKYLETVDVVNTSGIVVSDDDITKYICDNSQYVSVIYDMVTFEKGTKNLETSDDYKELVESDKLVPVTEGVSHDVIRRMFHDYKDSSTPWIEVNIYSSVYQNDVNMSEKLHYPRIKSTAWFTNTETGEVYINNKSEIIDAIRNSSLLDSHMENIKEFYLTEDGLLKLKSKIINNGKKFSLKCENNDAPLIGRLTEDIIKVDDLSILELYYSYQMTITLGDTILLQDRKSGNVSKHHISSEDDLKLLPADITVS